MLRVLVEISDVVINFSPGVQGLFALGLGLESLFSSGIHEVIVLNFSFWV